MKLRTHKFRILNAFNRADLAKLTAPNVEVATRSPDLRALIENMHHTLRKSRNGVGLAAPQIGVNLRIFVMRYLEAGIDEFTAINPTILHYVNDMEFMEEGCLSVPGVSISVPRSKVIYATWMDAKGTVHNSIDLHGMIARIFQHEYDHLHGKLLIDLSPKDGIQI